MDIETLDEAGTIAAIENLKREYMAKVEPFVKRLAAFRDAKPQVITLANGEQYYYTGPLPAPPEIKPPKQPLEGQG